ncbi:hypothetical protein [Geopseudomonas aromaticivorans]
MRRVLILLEFLVLFGPAMALLGLGLMFLPVMILGVASGAEGDWLIGSVVVICGSWGVVSAANLTFHLVANRRWPGKPIQLFGLGLGAATCSVAAFAAESILEAVVFAAPIIATIHFVAMAKLGRSAS